MRKTVSIMLAGLVLLLMCSCGAEKANTDEASQAETKNDNSESVETVGTEEEALSDDDESAETAEAEEAILYKIGETATTDVIACTLIDVKEDNGYIMVTYSLKNIGKKSLSDAWVHKPGSVSRTCAGSSVLDYNDGYIYDKMALNTVDNEDLFDLQPLGDSIEVTDVFCDLPEEVWNNKEAPLLVKIHLYSEQINEHAEYEESWSDMAIDAAKHTEIVVFQIR